MVNIHVLFSECTVLHICVQNIYSTLESYVSVQVSFHAVPVRRSPLSLWCSAHSPLSDIVLPGAIATMQHKEKKPSNQLFSGGSLGFVAVFPPPVLGGQFGVGTSGRVAFAWSAMARDAYAAAPTAGAPVGTWMFAVFRYEKRLPYGEAWEDQNASYVSEAMGACAGVALVFDEEAEGLGTAPPTPGMDTTNASVSAEVLY